MKQWPVVALAVLFSIGAVWLVVPGRDRAVSRSPSGPKPEIARETAGPASEERRRRPRVRRPESPPAVVDENAAAEAAPVVPELDVDDGSAREVVPPGAIANRAALHEALSDVGQPARPRFDLMRDSTAFAAVFRQPSPAEIAAGSPVHLGPDATDPTVLRYPAGRFELDPRDRRLGGSLWAPKDVEIEGAGMDRTLVVLRSPITLLRESRLILRDVTLHCNDLCPVELSQPGGLVRIERCRIVGFDAGGLGSQLLRGGSAAVRVTDCRIERGFGSEPGAVAMSFNTSASHRDDHGAREWTTNGPTVARFERTVFVGPFRSSRGADLPLLRFRRATAVQFAECEFIDMRAADRAVIADPPETIRLHECVVRESEAPRLGPERRDVAELNPDWATQPTREAEDASEGAESR